VLYSTMTHRFTVQGDLLFSLDWAVGGARSAGKDLGFDTALSTSLGDTHEAENESYQSRQAIWVDLSATEAVAAAVIFSSNAVSVRVDGNASPLTGLAGSGSFSTTLTASEDGQVFAALFAEQELRYWRFVLDGGADGFVEVSTPFLGPVLQLSDLPTLQGYVRSRPDYSIVQRALQGAQKSSSFQRGRSWTASWAALTQADREALEEMFGAVPKGNPFFWGMDPDVPEDLMAVVTETPLDFPRVEMYPPHWTLTLLLEELVE